MQIVQYDRDRFTCYQIWLLLRTVLNEQTFIYSFPEPDSVCVMDNNLYQVCSTFTQGLFLSVRHVCLNLWIGRKICLKSLHKVRQQQHNMILQIFSHHAFCIFEQPGSTIPQAKNVCQKCECSKDEKDDSGFYAVKCQELACDKTCEKVSKYNMAGFE